ncbi:MAG: NUDIX hydrolase [Flavobacteriaceae bacterium]
MYKVFVNKKEIVLAVNAPKKPKVKVLPLQETPLKKIIRILRTTKVETLYLVHHNPKKLLPLFKKKLPVAVAAGGVVQNEEGKVLFIYRKKRWDLPKGKVEKGETLQEGAKREVKEETGVKKIKVGDLVGVTYHIFKRNNRYQLKESHWFYMTTKYEGELVPQTKEDITKAVWKGKKKTLKGLEKTYPNIAHLFAKANLFKSLFEEE